MDLFDLLGPPAPPTRLSNWKPDEPPSLDGVSELVLNVETTGLRWWAGDRPVGLGIGLPGRVFRYLPFGHSGGNLDESAVKRWAQRELRGKRITNINTKFDVHHLREWGVNLEDQGCEVSDIAHYAALLDDHRLRFNLDLLCTEFLGGVRLPRVQESRMTDYHAGEVAPRAAYQAEAVWDLKTMFWPKLDAEDLQRVRALEDRVIYVVCEMEKNGARINVELLDRWVKESEQELHRCYLDLSKIAGFQVNPDSSKDMLKLFEHLKLPVARTAAGNPSFTGAILRAIEHPAIKLALRISKLGDLRSKYLLKYAKTVDRNTGILRYALHQLRSQKDPWSEESKGTVSGRFSSTQIVEGEGLNIQQIMKPEKQETTYGENWIIRELHIPEDGHDHLVSDAMQIEYRLFVEKTESQRLARVYEEDPLVSFHKHMWEEFKVYKPEMTYRRTKDVNFANIYGAGIRKTALMMEFITQERFQQLLRDKGWKSAPDLREVLEIKAIYNRLVPEVGPLLSRAQKLAEGRGYVRTILGRRSRFPDGEQSHKALNAVIQGSAADVMKQKLVELHEVRRETGFRLRYTVHDEVDGDSPRGSDTPQRVWAILNRQSFKTRVPLLWEVGTGETWRTAGEDDNELLQRAFGDEKAAKIVHVRKFLKGGS